MNHFFATDLNAEIRALNTQISELENQYAERFLDGASPELLKSIHLYLETLKHEVKLMEYSHGLN